jgi:dTDP-4-dehydrorhamnose 3,5-epimerase
MKVLDTEIQDVKIIEPKIFRDERGSFIETWNQKVFEKHVTGKPTAFVQDNQSISSQGVLRGLHYQRSNTQGKLVRVTEGEIFDVAVDVRKNSDTYGKWVGVVLTAENSRMLWVPEGFAHGFYVISPRVTFLYKCTDFYDPTSNVTIAWDDNSIGIDWPNTSEIILSENDRQGKTLEQCLNENILL